MKKILVINGNPVAESLSSALATEYIAGSENKGFEVQRIDVNKMEFDPNLKYGYKNRMEMEPDVQEAIEAVKTADHLVWVYPMWWYGMPALLKGFVDRTFLPEVAFRSGTGKLPEKLLKGKTARIIITADTPRWYDFLMMKSPAINQLKRGTLWFSGIKPVKVSYISPIKGSPETFFEKWLKKVNTLGEKGL